ncbi:Retinoic acid induced 16-like protein-domain-containing protein [Chytriomyces cf. hyalinus JEL632]|nr:Retinoic acid induced 16-like protein-domain-containing protein [Chytriomyces cf. hyalinus JEL632]
MAHIDFFQSFRSRLTNTFGAGTPLGTTSIGLKTRPSSVYLQPGLLQHRFQRAWDSIVLDYETESNWSRHVGDTEIVRNLNVMVDILVKEHAVVDGGVDPGGCTEKFLGEDMMNRLVRFSEADVPVGFRGAVITFLTNLLLVLDPKILIHNAIHRPLLIIIEQCLQSQKYDKELLMLELDICGKIYDYPQLLYIFFSKSAVLGTSNGGGIMFEIGSPALITGYECLIFDHILQHLHSESITGDYAREAALFLVELAAGDLATYIHVSEFSAVATAGLGGVFSQLPPRIPPGISWGEQFRHRSIGNTVRSSRPAESFRADVEAFIRVIHFVQAIVLRCPNSEITVAILEDFQGTFLDNIVQSTLTSASDFDGTTVSTLFYLQKMSETLKEESMVSMVIQFLLSSDVDEDVEDEAKKKALRKSMHRRSLRPSSIMSRGALLGKGAVPTSAASFGDAKEMRLHVRDILISKLGSLSEEVVIATLNLFRVIISNHSDRAIHMVIEKMPQPEAINRAIDAQNGVILEEPEEALAAAGEQENLADEQENLADELSPSRMASTPLPIPTTSKSAPFVIKISIHTHLWMVARYFALVPADSPNQQVTAQPQTKLQPASSSGPFDLFSMMDSLVGSSLDNSSQAFGSLVAKSNGLVPIETTLATYVAAAERIIDNHTLKNLNSRAQIDLEELLLLGAAGSSKGYDAERRKRKKAKTNIALNAMLGDGEEIGILKRGSLERNAMMELTKDTTLKKFMDKLSEFFSHSYSINLALTGVLSQLASAPKPLLYMYMFSSDLLLGQRGVIAPLVPTQSLYTTIIRLRKEVEERRNAMPNFDVDLSVAREELFGLRRKAPEAVTQFFGGMDEFDHEFYKNVVLLEEFTKEMLSILVMHGMCLFCWLFATRL